MEYKELAALADFDRKLKDLLKLMYSIPRQTVISKANLLIILNKISNDKFRLNSYGRKVLFISINDRHLILKKHVPARRATWRNANVSLGLLFFYFEL